MIAGGASAHSDHGRSVAEVFMSAAKKETDAYQIKDTQKLISIAPHLNVPVTVEEDGEEKQRDIDEDGIGDKCDTEDSRFFESNRTVMILVLVIISLLFSGAIFFMMTKMNKALRFV